MTYPIPGVGVSTPYGKRGSMWSCNANSSGGVHTGVDFACPTGTDIVAPIAGQIRHRSYGSAFGSHQFAISPDAGQPFGAGEVFFAHTTSRLADGTRVAVGQKISDVGAEGNVSGPHLHMEYHSDTKGQWSCSTHDNPQPILDYAAAPPTPAGPTNPNGVKVGNVALVTATGSLNGRSGPAPGAPVVTSLAYGGSFAVQAITDGWAQAPAASSGKFSAAGTAGDPAPENFAATGYLHGVDVSSHQPGWTPEPADEYVFVKATEGRSYTNPAYADQLYEARAAGLVVGHYHWLVPGNITGQVEFFLDNSDLQPGDLIACDWEDSGNPSTAEKDEWIRTLQGRLDGQHRVGLYCNRDWWINHDTSSFAGDFLWIANYTTADDPGIEAEWLFWQYTSTPIDQNRGRFADAAALRAWAGSGDGGGTPIPPTSTGAWFSTDYLFPKITPNPTNPNGLKKGDNVKVTASGGLTARTLPGGPQALDKDGQPLVRAAGYTFDVTADLIDGWVTGGTNWYSSDYLAKQTTPPPPSKPTWSSNPTVILDDQTPPSDRNVSYLQAVVRVAAMTDNNGKSWPAIYLVAQDYNNTGDLRIGLAAANGEYDGAYMTIKGAGHGQTFHAYRSAAGNLYVWCGEKPAYRYLWKAGTSVAKSSGTLMDYKGGRPVGSFEPWVGFRTATDTKETFYLFDRTDFTDGTNRTKPAKSITIAKQTKRSQQSWAVSADRIYRISGSTNSNPPNGTNLHVFEVFDWSGRLLLTLDVTKMAISTTSDEPEGITFSGAPGAVLLGKREGSTDPKKRSYPLWTMSGLP